MRFASRSDFGDAASPYGEALAAARTNPGFVDLTVSNPTRCGFDYPVAIATALGDATVLHYSADPRGIHTARTSIAELYAENYGAQVSPENILLTASTSEAYGYLLRLFCEPGDAILVPSPSYPLFDLLARLHDVELIPYPLVYHDGWQIDPASLAAAVTPRTRAIVAIHPNNPTGHFCSPADRDALFATALEHGLPLILDEVFLDYTLESASQPSFASLQPPVLTFVLGGLSKLLALPQMKLAWTVVCGPPSETAIAMERLEIIADTFLSIATPPQVALPKWLVLREAMQSQIQARVSSNLRALDLAIAGTSVSRLKVEGGWAVVLRIPANDDDRAVAIRLLQEEGIAAHPGSLYGFPSRGWLVLSLLTPTEAFRDGVQRLTAAVA
ncbi:aspartate/tyrosine/aromatic aminotransferase [Terriglobus roseus DSM 18391]|uniref:alanine transaminase n=1 Tax=Terriglobus roseus (strain DSM 18391 / NRRL B-41598 / KBS 63) TaxID=926566 RepID=I3ZG70_TERRK|nr:pyridoxal phosphate-dependent aminotransferase [Terriglobus roseus]AFL88238.1 aspartate/tyrosine/aromatic aminotransferase [Terriglobus roseus DSM 18391]